jgi:hypothetical protein
MPKQTLQCIYDYLSRCLTYHDLSIFFFLMLVLQFDGITLIDP